MSTLGTDLTALELAKTAPDCQDCVKVLEMAEARVLQRKQELVALDLGQAPVQCPRECGAGLMQQCRLTYHMLNECDLRPTGCDNCGGTLPFDIYNSITRPNAQREKSNL